MPQLWVILGIIAAILAISFAIWVIVGLIRRGGKSRATNSFSDPALTSDPLVRYVVSWRDRYERDTDSSARYYYVFTGIALLATSLVTAIGAIGGLFPTTAQYFLIATTFLGFVATIVTGFDRMFNDRKDFIRFGRYARLLDLEIIKYLSAVTTTGSAAGTTVDPTARKALVDATCKLLSDELSDWIQDETSAVVDVSGAPSEVGRAQEIGSAAGALLDAQDRAAQAEAIVRAAEDAHAQAQTAMDSAQAELVSIKAAGGDATAAKEAADAAAADVDEKQKAIDAATAALKTRQDDVAARQKALDSLRATTNSPQGATKS